MAVVVHACTSAAVALEPKGARATATAAAVVATLFNVNVSSFV